MYTINGMSCIFIGSVYKDYVTVQYYSYLHFSETHLYGTEIVYGIVLP